MIRKILVILVIIMFVSTFILQISSTPLMLATFLLATSVPFIAILAFRAVRWWRRRDKVGGDQ